MAQVSLFPGVGFDARFVTSSAFNRFDRGPEVGEPAGPFCIWTFRRTVTVHPVRPIDQIAVGSIAVR